ncbi:retrovirus-related pol polyprotein from transposon TNT 1-94 [Tanacetum coccineum]|uniref:Retrovirus-related pol polyprotein from transposon TNT 1-94 n=1 Tax=Tanacetum coccineum TaxID=301880 RepID=A0ABQ4XKD5_9ASTR
MNIVVNSSLGINTSVNVNSSIAMNDSVNYVEMCNKFELQAKDITIKKLKTNIKRLNKTSTTNSVKKDIDEIQTINIELEHRVAKLIAENEHLKQTYKQLYDSIKPSRVRAKEHVESLVNQLNQKHELCFLEFVSDMNASSKSKSVKNAKKKEEWKPTRKVFTKIGYNWRSTGRTFTLVGNAYPLTRITATNKVPLRELIPLKVTAQESVVTKVYTRRPKVVQIVLWYLDSGCSKHMTGDRSQLTNFVHKFLDTVKFGIDQIAKIMRYGDYQIGNITISRVYYVEGLGHNLFSVGQFCDSDLEVAFRNTRLPKLKFEKYHLCSACAMGKIKKQSHKPKSEDTNQEKLYLLHMDLYGPSVNGKKYILVIVDDYTRFTWVKFLASKDEAPNFIIKFLKMIQVRLNATVRNICTDNGTEFVNQTLRDYYEQVGISHETSIARTPQQNGVVERRNHTLVEAARIIKPDLSYLHVFGALCYPNNDSENLGKFQAKPDITIFIGYAPKKKAYCIYNRRTLKIIENINVNFDELTAMASEQLGSGTGLQSMTPATSSSGLVSNLIL